MNNKFVFRLSDFDTFSVDGAASVNINDSSAFRYTFWNPIGGKKRMYVTPKRFQDSALDLFYLSLMVYYVDWKVLRADQDDAWTRNMELYIPVKSLAVWERCEPTIKAALDFLTGDHWTLHFREYIPQTDDEVAYRKGRYHFRRSVRKIDTDTLCMLSGGLDSFIGAIDLLKDGKDPLFVSHYGGGKGVKQYQDDVVTSLATHFNLDPKRFFRFYAAVQSGSENSTRSRSLMFFAHAIAIASGMGHPVELFVPENGVISLNIPLTPMRSGSLSTRTTHPYFMGLLQALLNDLGIDVTLVNPYQFLTKGEMMQCCKDRAYLDSMYQKTLSCSHPDQGRWSGEDAGHCGECLPCTIRKAAIMKAGLTDTSNYRHRYETPAGKEALRSYRLGLATPKYPYAAIQMSGPVNDHLDDYASLYERGLKELKDYLDTV